MRNEIQESPLTLISFESASRSDPYPDLHMSPLAEPFLSRFGGGEFRHFFPIELQYARVFMPHDLQETLPWANSACWPHITKSKRVVGHSNVDSPASGEKTQHQWTPSMMHGRGAVKLQLGKQSEHRGSTGQSPAAWCPTSVLQLRWEWSKYNADMPFVIVRINVRYVMPCIGAPPLK